MEAKERILPTENLTDVAETLYNFRNAMDIDGIRNTLWQLAKQQDNVSFKAGIQEVVEWIGENSVMMHPPYDYFRKFGTDNWQTFKKSKGIE